MLTTIVFIIGVLIGAAEVAIIVVRALSCMDVG